MVVILVVGLAAVLAVMRHRRWIRRLRQLAAAMVLRRQVLGVKLLDLVETVGQRLLQLVSSLNVPFRTVELTSSGELLRVLRVL